MSFYEQIELQDCPHCGGAALLEEECGWCYYVTCVDCDCHTVEIGFKNEEEKLDAAQRAALLWNMGKVVSGKPGE